MAAAGVASSHGLQAAAAAAAAAAGRVLHSLLFGDKWWIVWNHVVQSSKATTQPAHCLCSSAGALSLLAPSSHSCALTTPPSKLALCWRWRSPHRLASAATTPVTSSQLCQALLDPFPANPTALLWVGLFTLLSHAHRPAMSCDFPAALDRCRAKLAAKQGSLFSGPVVPTLLATTSHEIILQWKTCPIASKENQHCKSHPCVEH